MASSRKINNLHQYSGRTPRFNYALTSFLLAEDAEKRAAKDFNPDRINSENTALLKKYWCMPNEKRIPVFQLLYFLGGNPMKLPTPAELTQEPFKKSLTDAEFTSFSIFLQQAQKAWDEEHGIQARTMRKQINEQAKLEKQIKRKLDETANEEPPKKIVALSIASGGSRSTIAALILRFVSNRLFDDESMVRRVHWIAASSMGSVLALNSIKEAHMKPTDCINLFWSLYGSSDRALKSTPGKTGRLEFFLRENFCETTMGSRMARFEDKDSIPKVFLTSAVVSPAPADLYFHTNYNRRLERCSPFSLSDAGRASSADPTKFDPFTDGQRLFISAGPPCNTPVYELNCEIKTNSPPLEIGALLSIEVGKNIDMAQKVRWFGHAQNATKIINKHETEKRKEFEVDESLIDIVLNPQQHHIETVLCDELNPQGTPPRYLRLNPCLPNSQSQPEGYRLNSLQYKIITQMWHTLVYLSETNTLTVIDDFHKAYKSSI